jgi:hypothetical protein
MSRHAGFVPAARFEVASETDSFREGREASDGDGAAVPGTRSRPRAPRASPRRCSRASARAPRISATDRRQAGRASRRRTLRRTCRDGRRTSPRCSSGSSGCAARRASVTSLERSRMHVRRIRTSRTTLGSRCSGSTSTRVGDGRRTGWRRRWTCWSAPNARASRNAKRRPRRYSRRFRHSRRTPRRTPLGVEPLFRRRRKGKGPNLRPPTTKG